ncbi:hypothetical protein D1BOALGB6SA_1696 [Olavius sp. associated proteobacterium Delta 1]|nr:hypothetical protein D1BOALGB6SA_1696 [Olavius sp. associated proteobacterium Delta 1]
MKTENLSSTGTILASSELNANKKSSPDHGKDSGGKESGWT